MKERTFKYLMIFDFVFAAYNAVMMFVNYNNERYLSAMNSAFCFGLMISLAVSLTMRKTALRLAMSLKEDSLRHWKVTLAEREEMNKVLSTHVSIVKERN